MSEKAGKLADDLFRLVEYDQGFSYISDGNDELDRDEFIEMVRSALDSHRNCVRILSRWLARVEKR